MERFQEVSHKEKKAELYSLGRTDFLESNELPNVQDFKLGDRITRDNFCSLLIKSFALSRGKQNVQSAFFALLKRKYNFDYKKTFNAFIERGGWHIFSEEEKALFSRAFDAVKAHSKTKYAKDKVGSISDELLRVHSYLNELADEDERIYLHEAAEKGYAWGEKLSPSEYGRIAAIREEREQKENERMKKQLEEFLKKSNV